jgi:hypothetical protein
MPQDVRAAEPAAAPSPFGPAMLTALNSLLLIVHNEICSSTSHQSNQNTCAMEHTELSFMLYLINQAISEQLT